MNIVIKLLIYFTDLYNIFSYIFIQFYEAKLNVEKVEFIIKVELIVLPQNAFHFKYIMNMMLFLNYHTSGTWALTEFVDRFKLFVTLFNIRPLFHIVLPPITIIIYHNINLCIVG